MSTNINRIQPDPRHQTAIRRVGRPQRDGDQDQDSFSETLEEEEEPKTAEPSGSSHNAAPKVSGEEGVGGQLDVVG